jgi:hypothetical protein
MIAHGVMGLVQGKFDPYGDLVFETLAASEVLVYPSALISLACGIGLLWRRTAALAARLMLASLLLWLLPLRVPGILLSPLWIFGGPAA